MPYYQVYPLSRKLLLFQYSPLQLSRIKYQYKGPSPFLFRTSCFSPSSFPFSFQQRQFAVPYIRWGLPRAVATFPLVGIWGHFCPPQRYKAASTASPPILSLSLHSSRFIFFLLSLLFLFPFSLWFKSIGSGRRWVRVVVAMLFKSSLIFLALQVFGAVAQVR